MSDELKRLTEALRAEIPRPSAEDRAQALAAAMEAFDRHRQESDDEKRLTGQMPKRGILHLRRFPMSMSRSSLALAASVAFLVVAGTVFHRMLSEPLPPSSVVSTATRTAAPAPAPGAPEPTAPAATAPTPPGQEASPLSLYFQREPGARSETLEQHGPTVQWAIGQQRRRRVGAESMPRLRVESGSPLYHPRGRDRFADFEPNPVKVVSEEPVSTFSIDVDTASYGFVRMFLKRGVLPQRNAVRVEEMINYFPYGYAATEDRLRPFAAHVSLMPAPWNDATRLMRIGIKGHMPHRDAPPRANLVFLIDTSGSMSPPNKLPLLVDSFKLLLQSLAPEDRVAIVTYAGSAGTMLEPTPVAEQARIVAALERLQARGSTAGAEGIRQAYLLARRHYVEDGVNRVILATDGDFNVGITDLEALESYIARERTSGVFLSVLGFGAGNYNDELAQRLAQNGNGNAAYIDSLSEAHKVLVQEAASTLFPIAKDVKIQVEFNPRAVSEYRLIGYETRMLKREDFRNDKVDAGEIGAGHTVTALYEVTPAGSGGERVPPLRYQSRAADPATAPADEIAFVRIRYKLPDSDTSAEITRRVTHADASRDLASAPTDARFAAAVAGFGQLLRGGRYTEKFDYDDVIELAQGARGKDPFGYRNEFVQLVRMAKTARALERLLPGKPGATIERVVPK